MSVFFQAHQLHLSLQGAPILHNIELQLQEREVTALLGHNGSGKSTLLKLLARQLSPSAGSLTLGGRALHQYAPRELARQVGYLPQHPPQTDGLTVQELVALGRFPWRGALGRYRDEDWQAVNHALAETDMEALRHRSVDTLSGGERQRAWIAMLLAQQTRCLLLDEPISALDVLHQVETLRLVRRLAQDRGLTVVMVLHDVDLAARFSDRLIALRQGRLIADGPPRTLMNETTLETVYDVPMGVFERAPGQWVSYVH